MEAASQQQHSESCDHADVEIARETPDEVRDALAKGARLPVLDVLRGVAIILVVASHSPSTRGASGILRPVDFLIHQFGWTGVDLFFILSGYLVGGLLLLELSMHGRIDTARFLIRRIARLWPAYYVFLCFVVARTAIEGHVDLAAGFRAYWPAFVHIQNYYDLGRDQLWSLAVEEHFYTLLALFFAFLGGRAVSSQISRGRAIPITCMALFAACALARIWALAHGDPAPRFHTEYSIDSLFLGVSLAYLSDRNSPLLRTIRSRPGVALGVAAVLCLPALLGRSGVRHTFGVMLVAVAFALLVTIAVASPRVAKLCEGRIGRAMALVGAASYSIYLWHRDTSWWAYSIARDLALRCRLPDEIVWLLYTGAYVTASVCAGILARWLIELPTMRLRARLLPARHVERSA